MLRYFFLVILWVHYHSSSDGCDAFQTTHVVPPNIHTTTIPHRRPPIIFTTTWHPPPSFPQPLLQRRMVAVLPPDLDVATTVTTERSTESVKSSFVRTKEECHPMIRIGNDEQEKIVNLYGIWCLFVSLMTFPIWIVAMTLVSAWTTNQHNTSSSSSSSSSASSDTDAPVNDTTSTTSRSLLFVDPHWAMFDTTGKLWAKVWLFCTQSYPTISGGPIQPHVGLSSSSSSSTETTSTNNNAACLYVANHASWLDIPILCTVLDPVFKFIAKGELRNVPGIGQQLHGVRTILLLVLFL